MENEYQEIDLKELIIIILKKWWLLTILAILSGGIAYYFTVNYVSPIYQAETSLFIGKEQNEIGGIGISLADLQTYNKLIVDYQQLARQRYVIEPVIDQLDMNMSIGAFRENLSISTIADSRFFTVKFNHTNNELAMDVANELAKQLTVAAAEIVEVENIRVIDEALLPVNPISPNVMMNVAIAVVLGLMIGLFIIFVLQFLDNTISKKEDLEKEFGITVIGVIPKYKMEEVE